MRTVSHLYRLRSPIRPRLRRPCGGSVKTSFSLLIDLRAMNSEMASLFLPLPASSQNAAYTSARICLPPVVCTESNGPALLSMVMGSSTEQETVHSPHRRLQPRQGNSPPTTTWNRQPDQATYQADKRQIG